VLAGQLQEATAALEELRVSRETMGKKMKIREKRVRELETETRRVAGELDTRNQELALVQQEKEAVFTELKDSRYATGTVRGILWDK